MNEPHEIREANVKALKDAGFEDDEIKVQFPTEDAIAKAAEAIRTQQSSKTMATVEDAIGWDLTDKPVLTRDQKRSLSDAKKRAEKKKKIAESAISKELKESNAPKDIKPADIVAVRRSLKELLSGPVDDDE